MMLLDRLRQPGAVAEKRQRFIAGKGQGLFFLTCLKSKTPLDLRHHLRNVFTVFFQRIVPASSFVIFNKFCTSVSIRSSSCSPAPQIPGWCGCPPASCWMIPL